MGGTSTTTYKYDTMDRVTEVCYAATCTTGSSPFIRYAYDAVGNRTSEARPTGTTTYTYNNGDQLTSKAGASAGTYTYDTNGNEVSAPSRTFAYDLANRTKSTTSGSTTFTYSYDGDGRRLQASSGTTAASKTNFLWDANNTLPQLALERDGSNSLLRRFVYGADLLSMNTGGADYYFHHDALGSTANLTSSAGATQWTYVYEPYGIARTETKVNNKAPVSPMKFNGQYFDSATSLYHLRARQYDPALGRFLSLDPVAGSTEKPFVSAYAYGDDAPTVLSDPSGLWTIGICGGVSVTVFHVSIQSKGCVVGSTHGQFGITGSGGATSSESRFGGLSATTGTQVSNARCIEDLSGAFVGASASQGGLGPQGDVFGGASRGRPVVGGELGVGLGRDFRGGGGNYTTPDVLFGPTCPTGGNSK
ncbi:MAG: hypothetical protein QOF27_985 [Gaiellaceae bacterium]|nr:hypothetical protein [Gaiellaceae bacterium]